MYSSEVWYQNFYKTIEITDPKGWKDMYNDPVKAWYDSVVNQKLFEKLLQLSSSRQFDWPQKDLSKRQHPFPERPINLT